MSVADLTPTTPRLEATSPLRHLVPEEIDAAARSECRNREVHLPPISVYRWWARRTQAVNGAILDAMTTEHPGRLLVADIFAGGGVIPLAAVTRNHAVYAQDLNPWAANGLHVMLNLPCAQAIKEGAEVVFAALQPLLEKAYTTRLANGERGTIAHTFRVATAPCPNCTTTIRLFPHAIVSLKRRKERAQTAAFVACRAGHLHEAQSDRKSSCPVCSDSVDPRTNYTARRIVRCYSCGTESRLETLANAGGWGWEVALVERTALGHRELSIPTSDEVRQADEGWAPATDLPEIPPGREAAVLRRHGFKHWHDLYPNRQRYVLEELLATIEDSGLGDELAQALRLAALGVCEMAGLASRWDRWYLKSYETMASHRFNFTTFTAEPNVWGTAAAGRGTFRRRVALFAKGAKWLEARTGKLTVERRSHDARRNRVAATTDVVIVEGSSERIALPRGVVDLVLTDPPYHDDVQYSELSLPLRAWAGLATDTLVSEAVAIHSNEKALAHYQGLLERIFSESRRILSPNGHLIFSYANRDPLAWVAVLGALHQAGFKAAGYALLHSENETDLSKRDVRACTMDLILDMVPATKELIPWRPPKVPKNQEADFLRLVGETLLESVGHNSENWVAGFMSAACTHEFIAKS